MTRKASDFHSGQRVTGQDHGTEEYAALCSMFEGY